MMWLLRAVQWVRNPPSGAQVRVVVAIVAAVILLGTGLVFYFMPAMMMSLSEISPWLSYALAISFVLAFFAVFWLRGRRQRKDQGRTD